MATINGTAGDDLLVGTDNRDTINGLGGDDELHSGVSKYDRLYGGDGDDALYADPGSRLVFLYGEDGADTLYGSGKGNRLDGGLGNDTLIGSDKASSADLLVGGAGADLLDGGGGDGDAASYWGSSVGVQIDLSAGTAAGGDAQGDVLTGIESLAGSAFDDVLTGDGGANYLSGGAGRDVMAGRRGEDRLLGGEDEDELSGGARDDYLDGGAGADVVDGGGGIDTILVLSRFGEATVIDLKGGTGQGAEAEGDTYISIENVQAGVANDTVYGDGGANVVFGWLGDDVLSGRGGDDRLNGSADNDVLSGRGGDDRLDGSADNDVLGGGGGNDILWGGSEDDILRGHSGDDQLSSDDGNDLMVGGAGADYLESDFSDRGETDIFRYRDAADSGPGAGNRDTISYFQISDGNLIDLERIDADAGSAGDDAFAFVGTDAFTGTAGELRYQAEGADTLVQADIDGDGTADFEILMLGAVAFTTDDFVL
jgi:Ca2+-binding RTX toxin-like protein